jgi:cobalt-zinc-cadmium efflux system outer membrane protein
MRIPKVIVSFSMAFWAAGCAHLSEERLENDVRQTVQARTGADPRWQRDSRGDSARRQAALALLQKGIGPDEAVAVALLQSPEAQLHYEELGLARAEFLAAASLPDPRVAWNRQSLRDGPGSNIEWVVLQNLTALLASGSRRGAARRQLSAAQALAATELIGLVASVRSAWQQAHAAQKINELAAQRADLARLTAELAGRYYEAGNISVAELNELQVAWQEQVAAAAEASAAAQQTRLTLARMLGIDDLNQAWDLRGEPAALPETETDLAQIEAAALASRLDVQAAKLQLDARLTQRRLQRMLRLTPDIEVGFNREREPNGERLRGVEIEAQIPLFTAAEVAVAESDAAARRALRQYQARVLDARREVRGARAALQMARERWVRWRDFNVPALESKADAQQREYFFMLIGPFEAMQARGEAIKGQIELTQAQRDYWLARFELARAAALPLQSVRDTAVAMTETPASAPQPTENAP